MFLGNVRAMRRTCLTITLLLALSPLPPAEAKPSASKKAEAKPSASKKTDPPFVHLSSLGCSGCHKEQYRQWLVSLHALAHKEPIYDAYFMLASRQSGKKMETFCGPCHTPVGVLRGELPFPHALNKPGDTKVGAVASEGLGCDFCHTVTGHTKVGNFGFIMKPSDVKLGPLKDPKPLTHKARYASHLRKAEYCGTCHQVTHPGNGIKLETTYEEWKKGPYAAAGVVCQDCHMTAGLPEGDGTAAGIPRPPRHPGKAAVMGPHRPHISRHYFVGPNVIFTPGLGEEGKKIRALGLALLRKAATLEILAPEVKDGRPALRVKVTNVGAGHGLPTGVTEIREMWLEVTAKDSRGKVLLSSGFLDKQGNIRKAPDGSTVIYRTEVHDAAGKDTTLFWNTVKKVTDRRIPPLASVVERYALKGKVRGLVTVKVRLLYRSVPPWGLAEAGLSADKIKVPVLVMAEAVKKVKVP